MLGYRFTILFHRAARAGLSAYYAPHLPEIARVRGPAIYARQSMTNFGSNSNQPCHGAAGIVVCASGCASKWGANVDLGWLIWGPGPERLIRQSCLGLRRGVRQLMASDAVAWLAPLCAVADGL